MRKSNANKLYFTTIAAVLFLTYHVLFLSLFSFTKKISLVTSRLNIGCIIPNIVKATAAMSRKDTKRCYWSNGRVQNTFGAVPDKKQSPASLKSTASIGRTSLLNNGWDGVGQFLKKKGNRWLKFSLKLISLLKKHPNEEAK